MQKEIIVKINNVNNFDKKALFEKIKTLIKVSPTSTIRGKQQIKKINELIREGIDRECYGRHNATDSIFAITNNNGWLAGYIFGGHYCNKKIDITI